MVQRKRCMDHDVLHLYLQRMARTYRNTQSGPHVMVSSPLTSEGIDFSRISREASHKVFIYPIHVKSDNHWVLLVAFVDAKTVVLVDSISRDDTFVQTIRRHQSPDNVYIRLVSKALKHFQATFPDMWTVDVLPTGNQTDAVSCGVFVSMYTEATLQWLQRMNKLTGPVVKEFKRALQDPSMKYEPKKYRTQIHQTLTALTDAELTALFDTTSHQ